MLARRPSACGPAVQHRTLSIDGLRFHCVEWGSGPSSIALCAATHPGLIRRAVLIDPILFPRAPEGQVIQNSMAHRARKRRMVWESRSAMFHSYHAREPFKLWREDVLWAYIEEGTVLRPDGHVELKCPGAIEAQVYEMAPRLDGFGALAQVS